MAASTGLAAFLRNRALYLVCDVRCASSCSEGFSFELNKQCTYFPSTLQQARLKMNLLRTALRSNSTFSTLHKSHGFPLLLRVTPSSLFSTEAGQPSRDSISADSFLKTPPPGVVYGRLIGIRKQTLKTDIIHLLKDCKLTMDDVKVEYNRAFVPLAMMLQFHSSNGFDQAVRMLARQGRLYKLETADRAQWDIVTPYDGKTILMQGIPRNATYDDIGRLLSGCDYDQTSLNLLGRLGAATVRFRSRTEAMNAFITKNRTFCLNNQISILVLQ
ncbi:uncharacterized protein G2W53_043624 [Senna tora]|uniref:Ribosomal protein S24e family protein n=1 Tax=Senna tora TaxID=362788 RepID=A0A834W043_9FABA|nr:uncharacterized protein G2W53_043624 [Senna tora]